jgi:hypothetical protein
MVVVTVAVEADLTAVVVDSMEAAEAPQFTEAVAARRTRLAAEHTDDREADTPRAEFRDTAGRAAWAEHEQELRLQLALASVARRRTAVE